VELRRGAEELRNEYRKVLNDFCESVCSSPSLDASTRLGCMLLIRLGGAAAVANNYLDKIAQHLRLRIEDESK
jgi:hypothetical protein